MRIISETVIALIINYGKLDTKVLPTFLLGFRGETEIAWSIPIRVQIRHPILPIRVERIVDTLNFLLDSVTTRKVVVVYNKTGNGVEEGLSKIDGTKKNTQGVILFLLLQGKGVFLKDVGTVGTLGVENSEDQLS